MSLIQSNVEAGSIVNLYYDAIDDTTHIERWMDAEPILDRIQRMKAHGLDGWNRERDMQAIAEVPITFLEQWMAEGVNPFDRNHEAEVLRRLNDPALAGFRLGDRRTPNGIIVTGVR